MIKAGFALVLLPLAVMVVVFGIIAGLAWALCLLGFRMIPDRHDD